MEVVSNSLSTTVYAFSCLSGVPGCAPASSFAPPASRNSNRHTPRLESLVSYRKQRIGPFSNRHKFAFCNSLAYSPSPSSDTPGLAPKLLDFGLNGRKHGTSKFLIDNFRADFPLAAPKELAAKADLSRRSRRSAEADTASSFELLPSRTLIENETHSRAESNAWQQRVYEFLIPNEFPSLAIVSWLVSALAKRLRPQSPVFGFPERLRRPNSCSCGQNPATRVVLCSLWPARSNLRRSLHEENSRFV